MLDLTTKRICVTGGAGFLGTYVCKAFRALRVQPDRLFVPRREDYDLTFQHNVERLYDDAKPDVVIHLAAEVGGIGANMRHPGRFFFANMSMGMHMIEQARIRKITKFVQTGTSCAYPKFAPVPFREEKRWNG